MSDEELAGADEFAAHMERVGLRACAAYMRLLIREIRRLKAFEPYDCRPNAAPSEQVLRSIPPADKGTV